MSFTVGGVAPDGQRVTEASSDQEEILLANIDLNAATGPPLPRRPECYEILTTPTEELPVTGLLTEPVVPAETTIRVGLLQLYPYTDVDAYLDRVGGMVERLERQEAQLVILPGVPADQVNAPAYQVQNSLPKLQELSARLGCGLATPLVGEADNGRHYLSCYVIDEGAVLDEYHQVHLHVAQDDSFKAGYEIPLRTIARCRADENKVFVALATPVVPNEAESAQTGLFSPNSAPLSAALPDIEQGIAGQVSYALTRLKEMAPNTHVVRNRQPETYGQLLQ